MNYLYTNSNFLGIIFVVAGHCDNGGVSLFYDWFPPYAFHLGLFAFCSGYFYKTSYEDNISAYIMKKIKHLIIPVYVWNIIYGVLVYLLSFKGFTIGGSLSWDKFLIVPITTGHQFGYNLGGWFVIPLFMIEVFNVVLRRYIKIKNNVVRDIIWFSIFLGLGIVGVILANKGYNTGWGLVGIRALFFLPYYGLGFLYKNNLEKIDNIPNSVHFIVIIALQLIFIMIYKHPIITNYAWCVMAFENPIIPYVEGFLGIAFWLRIAICLEPVLGKNSIVNIVADNAFSVMIHQLMGFMIVKTFFAVIFRLKIGFVDFEWERYKSEVYYYYLPWGIEQFKIVYLFAGVSFPILVSLFQDKITEKIMFLKRHDKIGVHGV